MADLSDKGRSLLNDLMRAASNGPGEDVNQAFSAALDWVCALESVASAAPSALAVMGRSFHRHCRESNKCVYDGKVNAELVTRCNEAREAIRNMREALRRLDGAGEGDGNG